MQVLVITFEDGGVYEVDDYTGDYDIDDGYVVLYRRYNPPTRVALENMSQEDKQRFHCHYLP